MFIRTLFYFVYATNSFDDLKSRMKLTFYSISLRNKDLFEFKTEKSLQKLKLFEKYLKFDCQENFLLEIINMKIIYVGRHV